MRHSIRHWLVFNDRLRLPLVTASCCLYSVLSIIKSLISDYTMKNCTALFRILKCEKKEINLISSKQRLLQSLTSIKWNSPQTTSEFYREKTSFLTLKTSMRLNTQIIWAQGDRRLEEGRPAPPCATSVYILDTVFLCTRRSLLACFHDTHVMSISMKRSFHIARIFPFFLSLRAVT